MIKGLLRTVSNGHIAYCPGCKCNHLIPSSWSFNNDYNKPTFTPSLLVKTWDDLKGFEGYVCHSFITNGQWQYCSDSMHELSGQTVDLGLIEETE